jgi:hypothetical protein
MTKGEMTINLFQEIFPLGRAHVVVLTRHTYSSYLDEFFTDLAEGGRDLNSLPIAFGLHNRPHCPTYADLT